MWTLDKPNTVSGIDASPTELAQTRQRLSEVEAQLGVLKEQTEQLIASSSTQKSQATPAIGEEQVAAAESQDPLPESFASDLNATSFNAQASLRQRLLDNGFNEQEVQWIEQQRAEAQSDRLTAIYQARRERAKRLQEAGQQPSSPFRDLRDRLGDEAFERYLAANGQPTSIEINSVLPRSPGENAGLQVGDKITHYDGERVFNVSHLNSLTVLGEEGESILVEVQREGGRTQITLPRGPIGIRSGG